MTTENKYPFGKRISSSGQPQQGNDLTTKRPNIGAFTKRDLNSLVAEKYVQTNLPVSREKDEKMKPPTALAQHIVQQTATNVMDNENILQLLPDMELAMQVLIAAILAPNNMMTCELNYICDADDLSDLKALLIEVIKNYFRDTYKINSILPIILEDVLFKKGSYPLATIPETAIDEIITGNSKASLESLNVTVGKNGYLKPVGILGNSNKKEESTFFNLGMESIDSVLNDYDPKITGLDISVTDNVDILKFPKIHQKMVEARVSKAYEKRNIGLENAKLANSESYLDSIFNTRRESSFTPVVPIKTLDEIDRPTIGHPLVLNLPPESVIVVHVPSEPSKAIGYFIALDRHGNPIRANLSPDYFADFSYNTQALKDMSTQLLSQTRRNTEGRADLQEMMLDDVISMYTEVVERDVRNRLRNGLYGDNLEVSKPTEVYRTMMYRRLAGLQTQLLFIPIQLMTYIAFDYNYYGNGKSLLESTKILSSIRSMMLFANTMAAIKNSTNHVELNLEFDPADPDPRKTAEMFMMEYAKVRQSAYPIGASNPLDMVNYIQNAGVTLTTSNHPNFPETKFTIEDRQSSRALIDADLDENLKKRHLAAIGIAPETVDLSMNVDFAQSIVNSNILLAKRALVYQKLLTGFVTDFICKYTINSSILMEQLVEVVKNNLSKVANEKLTRHEPLKIVKYFLAKFQVTLPEPDMTKLENQKEAFELYSETLEAVLPAFISSEMFDSSIFGDLSENVETTIEIVKSYFLRRWMQNNDVLPEVFELLESDKDGQPLLDVLKLHESHMDSVSKSLVEFMKKALRKAHLNTQLKEKLGELAEGGGESDSGSDDSGSDDSGGGDEDAGGDDSGDEGGDEGGGDDDFGDFGDDDLGGEDEGSEEDNEEDDGGEEDEGDKDEKEEEPEEEPEEEEEDGEEDK